MTNRRQLFTGAGAIAGSILLNKLGMPTPAKAANTASAKAAGFRMPLESDPHARTFMQWPSRTAIYGGRKALEAVRQKIALIATSIAKFEPVVVLAREDQVPDATKSLGSTIEVWPIATEDLWCRDSGPTFVLSGTGQVAVTELKFNGWGNKQTHADDGQIAGRVAAKLGLIPGKGNTAPIIVAAGNNTDGPPLTGSDPFRGV